MAVNCAARPESLLESELFGHETCSGNTTRAAQVLGFDRKTLYAKLKQYGVDERG